MRVIILCFATSLCLLACNNDEAPHIKPVYLAQKNDSSTYYKHFDLATLKGTEEMTDTVQYPFFEVLAINTTFLRLSSHIHPDTVNKVYLKKYGNLHTIYYRLNKKPDGKYPYSLRIIDTLNKHEYRFDGFGGIFDENENITGPPYEITNRSLKDTAFETHYTFSNQRPFGRINRSSLDRLHTWLGKKERKVHRYMNIRKGDKALRYEDSLVITAEDNYNYLYVNNNKNPQWHKVVLNLDRSKIFKNSSFGNNELDKTHLTIDRFDGNYCNWIGRMFNTRNIDLNEEEYLRKKRDKE